MLAPDPVPGYPGYLTVKPVLLTMRGLATVELFHLLNRRDAEPATAKRPWREPLLRAPRPAARVRTFGSE